MTASSIEGGTRHGARRKPDYVARPDDQKYLEALIGRHELDPDEAERIGDNILLINGSGLAGKSQLLKWSFDALDSEAQDDLIVIHGQLEMADGLGTTVRHIDAWADALVSMRDDLVAKAQARGLRRPRFTVFDAFYKRCVTEGKDADVPFRRALHVLGVLAVLVVLASDILSQFSLENLAESAAAWISPVIPGAERVITFAIYALLIVALVYNAIAASVNSQLVRLRDLVWRSGTYRRFGKNPARCPERLGGEDPDRGSEAWPKDFSEQVLIRAFNADLATWLESVPNHCRVLIAFDVQDLPPADLGDFRKTVREAIDSLLGRFTRMTDDQSSAVLAERAPIAVCSKFVYFPEDEGASSPLRSALARPREIGFLTREAAWDLVGKRIESWRDEAGPSGGELWRRMLKARALPGPAGVAEWSLLRGRNEAVEAERTGRKFVRLQFEPGPVGDYHLLMLQVSLAFGGSTAANAIAGSGRLRDEDFDQRLAGSIDFRLKHFKAMAGDLLERNFAHLEAFRGYLLDATTPVDRTTADQARSRARTVEELGRALRQDYQGLETAAVLLAPFRFGLTSTDIREARLPINPEDIGNSSKITVDDGTTRMILRDEDRRLILFARAHEAETFEKAYRRIWSSIEDAIDDFRRDGEEEAYAALTWATLASVVPMDGADGDEVKAGRLASLAARFTRIADRVLTLGGYSHLSREQNAELQHRLGEAVMRQLAAHKFPQRGGARRWNFEARRPEVVAPLQDVAQRYMRRYAFGQMDLGARTAFVSMLRKRGSQSPVVRDLARFLAEQGGSLGNGDWLEDIAIMHEEGCRSEAVEQLLQIDPRSLTNRMRLGYLHLLRKSMDSLASRCLPDSRSDPDPDVVQAAIDRAEQEYLEPLFSQMQSGMEDMPDDATQVAFMALRTAMFWQTKLRRFPVARDVDGEGRERFEFLAAASRGRQRAILEFLDDHGGVFAAQSEDDFADITALLAMDDALKGEEPARLDDWLHRSRRAFFAGAAQALDGDCAERRIDGEAFAQVAQALAVSLSAYWRDDKKFMEGDRDLLWPEMVSLRAAYCDFAARRFAAANKVETFDTADPDYRTARDRFAATDYFAGTQAGSPGEAMAGDLLRAVAHASPQDPPDRAGAMLVVDSIGAVSGSAIDPEGGADIFLCRALHSSVIPALEGRLVPPKVFKSRLSDLPVADEMSKVQGAPCRPMLVSLLGSSGDYPPVVRRASAKGDIHVGAILDIFLPLAPAAQDRLIRMGGSRSIAALGVTPAQLAGYDAAANVLALLLSEIASLNRVILFEHDSRAAREGATRTLADRERDMTRFLNRAMKVTWHIDGDKSYAGDAAGDPGPASKQTIRKGPSMPAFLPRYSEQSGTVDLLSLNPNPQRPAHSPPTLRAVHSLFPKVFEGVHPEYEFNQVTALMRPLQKRAAAASD